ncbi:hypothetical protein DFH06DRAFT_1252553 [Mycena polygramma]|nr:hypothetical protein DFH06DRAFT_1252553 [Mycena polygramma]
MYVSLAQLPQDVLLEIANQLDVADVLNLLAICRPLRELQFERGLWLDALKRIITIQMQPVPCDDPESLTLAQLQDVVHRACRLMRNLLSEAPRLVSTRVVSITRMDRIFCIPGQNIVVAYSMGSVDCWDTLTSKRVTSLRNPDLVIRSEAPCMDTPGVALIAASIGINVHNLVAIRIDFRERAHIGISYVASPGMTHTYTLRGRFFITPEVLGVCTHFHTFSWSMKAGDPIQTTAQEIHRPAGAVRPLCVAVGNSVYAFHGGSDIADVTIQRLPLPLTPSLPGRQTLALDPSSNITALDVPYSFASSQRELRSLLGDVSMYTHPSYLFPPTYGVFAVTYRSFRWDNIVVSAIHFWPAHAQSNTNRVYFEQGCFYEHPDPIAHIAVGASGTYVLLLVLDSTQGGPYLGLLHFSRTPFPRTTFRRLDTGTYQLSGCLQVALDDALGLALLVDARAGLTVFSYV